VLLCRALCIFFLFFSPFLSATVSHSPKRSSPGEVYEGRLRPRLTAATDFYSPTRATAGKYVSRPCKGHLDTAPPF
jgi:hypothetical protein